MKCIALHGSSIIHSPSVCRFLSFFLSLSLYFCLSLSLSVSLALVCCRFNIRTPPVIRWQGCTPSQISKSAVLPEKMCGRLQTPDKCQRGSMYNLWVQTLPQDTAAVFYFVLFFLQCHNKGRIKQREAFFSPKPEWLQRMTKEEVIRRKRGISWRDNKWVKCLPAHLFGFAVLTVISQILPVGQI